jgi:hypothetical protein
VDLHPAVVLTALDTRSLELAQDEIVTSVYVLLDSATGMDRIARARHLRRFSSRPTATTLRQGLDETEQRRHERRRRTLVMLGLEGQLRVVARVADPAKMNQRGPS